MNCEKHGTYYHAWVDMTKNKQNIAECPRCPICDTIELYKKRGED